MKTITFYSYKGGVGRTLALSNIAIRLSELNKSVCLLDFDLEAPGLPFKFKSYKKSKPIERGIVDYIYKFCEEGTFQDKIIDYSIQLDAPNSKFKPIRLIPAGQIEEEKYWKQLSSINWSELFYSKEGKGVKFFLDLKNKIEKEISPDVLLIDSRTGITDISGITLKLLADEVVVLASYNEENIFGSKKILNILLDPTKSFFEKTPKISFLLTRLPFTDVKNDKSKEYQIVEKIKNEFKEYLKLEDFDLSVIHSDRRLEENECPLIGYEYEEKVVSISNDYLRVFDRLTSDILSPDEVKLFQNSYKAEREYNKALRESDYSKKIQFLNNAIELNPLNFEYFFTRGYTFTSLKKYDEAINDYKNALLLNSTTEIVYINLSYALHKTGDTENLKNAIINVKKALELNPNDSYCYRLFSFILDRLGKPKEALEKLNEGLEKNSNDDLILNSKADLLRRNGDLENAYNCIRQAIEINPKNSYYFATLAEINASNNNEPEFYYNLNIAFSLGLDVENLYSAKDVYMKFKNESRFIDLLSKYDVDIDDIFTKK